MSKSSTKNTAEGKGKKVLVGMSGGVDSSVTACLLKERGYDVIGIHLKFWTDPTVFSPEELTEFPQNKCCTLEGLAKTRQLAAKLDIPFYVLNFEDAFKKDVIDPFLAGYAAGETPNPCVDCNRDVKFGLFLEKMKELGADYVATGHYARIHRREDGIYELRRPKDLGKDQTYFLYTLTQEKLKHILFPIGEYTKPEVRELARKFGIDEVNNQKESQNLCFFPEKTHGPFLQRHLKKGTFRPGPIVTVDGQVVGQHIGLPHYTIGQRKGLGVGGIKDIPDGTVWYVVRLDSAKNAVVIGQDKHLFHGELTASNLSFVDGEISEKPQRFHAKIRSRFPAQPSMCEVLPTSGSQKATVRVTFEKPQRAITPGQSVVLYDGDTLIGGGIIQKAEQ